VRLLLHYYLTFRRPIPLVVIVIVRWLCGIVVLCCVLKFVTPLFPIPFTYYYFTFVDYTMQFHPITVVGYL